MCTLSIIPYDGQLIVTMNRDEHRSRGEARDMRVNHDFAYPCDVRTSGTWFGVNRHGLIMALLNRYDMPHGTTALSRGRIIPALLSADNIGAAMAIFENTRSTNDNPFDLVLVSHEQALHIRWDGQTQSTENLSTDHPLFFTSSSENAQSVLPFRQSLFQGFIHEKWPGDKIPETILDSLHLKVIPDAPSSSIFMQRESTHTKSVIQAVLSQTDMAVSYWTEEEIAKITASKVRGNGSKAQQTKFEFYQTAHNTVMPGPLNLNLT